MSSVTVNDLEVKFGHVTVLHKLDLDVQQGEFLVLLGPSGCGKSTLLHSIAGLLDASDGSIHIGDRDVTFEDPKDRAIGMVFQSYALYPTMNVERNMSFGLRVAGVPKREISRRVEKASKMLQLDSLLSRKPAQLSGGQRQRVAIGRALVREAQVFLFDEPLSNLDAKLRTELRREIKQLHHELGATMIYVTHDQVEAMTLATRVAVMRGGRIQQIGTPAQVYATPATIFVAGFLGSPSMNFIQGHLRAGREAGANGSGSIEFDASGWSIALPPALFSQAPTLGIAATLGIRPEHLSLVPVEAAPLAAEVVLVEPLGSHAVVWLSAQGQRLAAIVDAVREPALGDRVGLAFDLNRASVFDPATEQRL